MFDAKKILYLYIETSLHAGVGRGIGSIDLPIQRERTTGYPVLHASGIKGSFRAEARKTMTESDLFTVFGPETSGADSHAGAISFGDARILLFPVQSLSGTFAWATSIEALAGFIRMAAITDYPIDWNLPAEPASDQAYLSHNTKLKAGDYLVLEESSFTPTANDIVTTIGTWLAQHALPDSAEYDYWQKMLPQKLCILPENSFKDFLLYATEVQTHVKLNPESKTVETGALWVTESLPMDTLMYLPIFASASRNKAVNLDGEAILRKVSSLPVKRLQLGGDESTGQGIVALRFGGAA